VLVEPPLGLVKLVGNPYTVIILCKMVLDPASDKLEGPREQSMHPCLPDVTETKLFGRQPDSQCHDRQGAKEDRSLT
jgi:hypothetical protein